MLDGGVKGFRLGAGGGGDPDFGGTGTEEDFGALAGGGAGSHDVVDEKDFATGERGGVDDAEGTVEVGAALMGVEVVEGPGVLDAEEEIGSQMQVPAGGGAAKALNGGGGRGGWPG